MVKNFRKWNFDRWIRGVSVHIGDVLLRIENARVAGFTYPMRLFLTAERREHGFLREEYQIAEFIDIDESKTPVGRGREIVANVMRAHEFGICWGGDPGVVVDRTGALRGIDLYRGRATWLERGKDLDCLSGKKGVPLPRFFLNVAAVRVQTALKDRRKPKVNFSKW